MLFFIFALLHMLKFNDLPLSNINLHSTAGKEVTKEPVLSAVDNMINYVSI
jgi:hypothetical protein